MFLHSGLLWGIASYVGPFVDCRKMDIQNNQFQDLILPQENGSPLKM